MGSGSEQGNLILPPLINTVLEILGTAIRQEKYIKGIQTWGEGGVKLFAEDNLVHRKS